MDENLTSEQLEEGEIVDDGEFEDISDNSIIESTLGKFVSSNENLRALPLSSDSESELIRELRHKKKLLRRKTKLKHQRRRKKRRITSDTSDSDSSPPRELKCKLKEAIHISGIEESHKNTLETRLRAMGVTNTQPVESVEPPTTETKAKESTDKVDDTELENLRMEALKTAVLNKFQRRKRKKAEGQEAAAPMENKENDTPEDEQNGEKLENNAVIDLEEDEDLLRASLLAGLAKKIAKKTESVIPTKPVAPKLPVQVIPALPKNIVNNFKSKVVVKNRIVQKIIRPKPQVKPLIINVNDDSDTEDEIKQKQPVQQKKVGVLPPKKLQQPFKAVPKVADLSAIQNNVEKFLKEQRAKFETENQKNVPVLNRDKSILEKSAVKLLPKSQQIEYQLLLKRLRNAEKRKRAKKLAQQKLISAETAVTNHVIGKARFEVAAASKDVVVEKISTLNGGKTVENITKQVEIEDASKSDSSPISKVKSSRDSDTSERKLKVTNELTTLQKTLKEIKTQRNGSLQIKSKYQVLTPIIRKITETSNQRKKHENRIKTLLQELDEARNCLANAHEQFSNLVKELVAEKEKIDRSFQGSRTVVNGNRSAKESKFLINSCVENIHSVRNNARSAPVTSTPIKTNAQCDVVEEPTVSTLVTSSTNNECEDMDVCNSDETDICQIDIVDPNDIDQIFKRKPPPMKSTIPEYVSPLNFNTNDRYRHVDPLGIMCPYEVNGSCRDTDCTYKHYLKSHERL